MQVVIKGFSILLVVLTMILVSGQAIAQSDQGTGAREFGLGQPEAIQDLPPGQLRNRLESLPPQASSKALRWLQDFSFPSGDLETIKVDDQGGVLYIDTNLPDPVDMENSGSAGPTVPANVPTSTLDNAFLLHSRPGASNVVFVDFDGDLISGTAWNNNGSTIEAVPYNIEGAASTFSALERTKIVDIWHRIAEDLAPYDIDVTTEEPAVFNSNTGHLLITHSADASGQTIYCTSCGGVAYVGVFGGSNYAYYSPALVFFDKLGGGFEHYVAEAASHEFGHNLGLGHDGTSTVGYYSGHGSGLVSWAPIMGVGYYNNVTEWSKGEYPDANNHQDDRAIIDGKLGYDADDHGDTPATAAFLTVDADGSVISSNPELDPDNVLTGNKGIIGSSTDVDVFSFTTGAGTINLTINPAWDAFYRSSNYRGANLDIEAELQNLSGATLALNDPLTNTSASVSASVSAGTYYLLISGVGNTSVPYSDYGSLGQYFISGSVPSGVTDTTAPTPNPMSWASVPAAISESAISMTATTASDDISAVKYNFQCVAGGPTGCENSGWQSSTAYTAAGLAAGTSYTFSVKANDQAGNETTPSVTASATTDTPPPYTNYAAISELAVAGSVSGSYANTVADGGSIQTITERESGGKPANRHTYLEHRWNFNVSSGASVTLYANAWRNSNSDSDGFRFEYSINGGSSFASTALFTVTSTNSTNLEMATIPNSPSGSIVIRVIDTNQSNGERFKNAIVVDHLYIQVGNPSTDLPDGDPREMTAKAISSSQIDLVWINGSTNEAGFTVERSENADGPWTMVVPDLPATSTSYSDTELTELTQYFYQVRAFNANGFSEYTTANATTPVAPPQPTLSLSASGRKVKGKHHVDLSWSGASSVAIFRNGNLEAADTSLNPYDDNIGTKGGATYTHQVCPASTTAIDDTCSNETTTVF